MIAQSSIWSAVFTLTFLFVKHQTPTVHSFTLSPASFVKMSSLLHRKISHRDHSLLWTLNQSQSSIQEEEEEELKAKKKSNNHLDIVLFGIGDFRVTDHPGFRKALVKGGGEGKILPLVILDQKDTLPNIPMGRIHTLDNAALLHSAMISLNDKLMSFDKNLKLHVKTGRKNEGVQDLMLQVLDGIRSQDPDIEKITIHACDLGQVDNQLGYSPLIHLENMWKDGSMGQGRGFIELNKWNCHLREETWKDISEDATSFPNSFVDYETKYNLVSWNDQEDSLEDVIFDVYKSNNEKSVQNFELESLSCVPPLNVVTDLVCSAFDYDIKDSSVQTALEQDRNTGLYATHWGGLDIPLTFTEDCALGAVDIFLGGNDDGPSTVDGDEALVEQLGWWQRCNRGPDAKLTRNHLSLEHSALDWMMTGGSDGSEVRTTNNIKTENLIEGELLTRYLAAPLLFGLISPRMLLSKAHAAMRVRNNGGFLDNWVPPILKSRQSANVVKTIAEGREWHKLFAYKNNLTNNGKDGSLAVGYWRWHGFLCRYVGHFVKEENASEKQGTALVHGFGASGSQWIKVIEELQKAAKDQNNIEVLAPDLMGFGQSEKPSLTYTQYLWESYTLAFMKDIALGKRNWDSFTIGGNSIGGYTAMGAAADDSVTNRNDQTCKVTASGSKGSGKCRGLVLMNSAGKVFKREEIESMKVENGATVAEATANDLLGIAR